MLYISCLSPSIRFFLSFFFNDTATTDIYTLSLHDALPICRQSPATLQQGWPGAARQWPRARDGDRAGLREPGRSAHRRDGRSEEHTSELQSQSNLVCRLLLEKKKKKKEQIQYLSHQSKHNN